MIIGSALRTCLGDGASTFDGLLAGASGVRPLCFMDGERLNVRFGYHVVDEHLAAERQFRASTWLGECVADALTQAGVNPAEHRVVAVTGTGLREVRSVERFVAMGSPAGHRVPAHRLHFGDAVREAAPGVTDVLTLANACSAGGHALALAQDLLDLGEADAVVVGAADSMAQSMLAMIGRVTDEPTTSVRPFDVHRTGVLLGEGAAAVVLVAEGSALAGGVEPLARVLATGLSCDAHHETAPDVGGVLRAMRDALTRADRQAGDVDLVLAHGTGTMLNDPMEATALRTLLGAHTPKVTAVKGSLGHTSGAAHLVNLDVAVRALRAGVVPPVTGLSTPIDEAADLDLVTGAPAPTGARLAQVDAFGFGGVNAVTMVEAVG